MLVIRIKAVIINCEPRPPYLTRSNVNITNPIVPLKAPSAIHTHHLTIVLTKKMEFVPSTPVHRVLCADCGALEKLSPFLPLKRFAQGYSSCQILPTCVLGACAMCELNRSVPLHTVMKFNLSIFRVDITEGIPKQGSTEKLFLFSPTLIGSLTKHLCHSVEIVNGFSPPRKHGHLHGWSHQNYSPFVSKD
jgi:hypothetical protein